MQSLEIAMIVIQLLCTTLVTFLLFVAKAAHNKGTEMESRMRKLEIKLAALMGYLHIPEQIESD